MNPFMATLLSHKPHAQSQATPHTFSVPAGSLVQMFFTLPSLFLGGYALWKAMTLEKKVAALEKKVTANDGKIKNLQRRHSALAKQFVQETRTLKAKMGKIKSDMSDVKNDNSVLHADLKKLTMYSTASHKYSMRLSDELTNFKEEMEQKLGDVFWIKAKMKSEYYSNNSSRTASTASTFSSRASSPVESL
ncbi:MAG: hypothetical protein M1114_06965 [Candidatus Dependentiae bacterium]|nr:hypothetical protein [Candidatus Dependentiae bacterium]